MATVEVQKVNPNDKSTTPVFGYLSKRFDEIRKRAFELFEKRGGEEGHALKDWLQAEREMLGFSRTEFTDKGDAYEIQLSLPGVDAKDVEVTATAGEIVVHAASKREKKSESDNVFWSEFTSEDVYRRLPAPTPVDADKTTATLEKGVLRITAPKVAEAKTKAVAIKSASAA